MTKAAIQRAIDAVGSLRQFAALLEISTQSVCRWKSKYKRVPQARVLRVSEISGIPPHELRPDIYPNPTDALPVNKQSNLAKQ